MNNQNVTVEDIEEKLASRHKISGNKKDFHTRGEY
jgi:phosphoribosyl-ATP pyrophosphohydrolase/phosphoribosyl-AMP cyclohydrolase